MRKHKAAFGLIVTSSILLLALLALALPAPAGAQVQSVDTTKPIVVKSGPKPKVKYAKFSGHILTTSKQQIVVRGVNYDVRTFRYTPKVGSRIAKGLAKGNYGAGQPVEVKYASGSDVASAIKR